MTRLHGIVTPPACGVMVRCGPTWRRCWRRSCGALALQPRSGTCRWTGAAPRSPRSPVVGADRLPRPTPSWTHARTGPGFDASGLGQLVGRRSGWRRRWPRRAPRFGATTRLSPGADRPDRSYRRGRISADTRWCWITTDLRLPVMPGTGTWVCPGGGCQLLPAAESAVALKSVVPSRWRCRTPTRCATDPHRSRRIQVTGRWAGTGSTSAAGPSGWCRSRRRQWTGGGGRRANR